MSATFDILIPPLSSSRLDAIQSQHQAAVRLAEQSELHAVLAGKALLALRRGVAWVVDGSADTAGGHRELHTHGLGG